MNFTVHVHPPQATSHPPPNPIESTEAAARCESFAKLSLLRFVAGCKANASRRFGQVAPGTGLKLTGKRRAYSAQDADSSPARPSPDPRQCPTRNEFIPVRTLNTLGLRGLVDPEPAGIDTVLNTLGVSWHISRGDGLKRNVRGVLVPARRHLAVDHALPRTRQARWSGLHHHLRQLQRPKHCPSSHQRRPDLNHSTPAPSHVRGGE